MTICTGRRYHGRPLRRILLPSTGSFEVKVNFRNHPGRGTAL